jgi:chromate reductase, NAD(P)H dehydrogenase (quinone)
METIQHLCCNTVNKIKIMYTIVAGTNRVGSNSLKVAKEYQRFLAEKGVEAKLLSLQGLDILNDKEQLAMIEKDIIIPTNKFFFIVPEYNGSYPGILKLLFDTATSHSIWWHKKALLTGVSTGRGGNIRGLEHFNGVLNYLKVTVFPDLLPISVIDKLMDAEGRFTDAGTIAAINKQLDNFLEWYN